MNRLSTVKSQFNLDTRFFNVVSNPNFSTPSISNNSYSYVSSVSNWSFAGPTYGIIIHNGVNPWSSTVFIACPQALAVQFNNLTSPTYTVSQNLSLVVGTYTVSFYTRPRASYFNTAHTLTASLNGISIKPTYTNTNWTKYTFQCPVSSMGSYLLSFVFYCPNSTGDTSISISGISVILNP